MRVLIDSFTGDYAFLSNFAPSPIRQDGRTWPTAEHLFQSMKCVQQDQRNWVATAPTPGEAKRRGHSVSMRSGWEQHKRAAMLRVVLAKFEQNPDLAANLAATYGAELVEGNTWGDRYWGRVNGVGENWLGRILMWVREVLPEAERPTFASGASVVVHDLDWAQRTSQEMPPRTCTCEHPLPAMHDEYCPALDDR